MKKMTMVFVPVMALSALFSTTAAVAETGYVVDSSGQIVKDQFGGCVRDSNWKKDTVECGGKAPVAPVAKPAPAPAPAPVVKPAPAPEPIVPVAVVDDAPAAFVGFFEVDKADLTQTAEAQLDVYADYMQKHGTKKLVIRGYTDAQGSEDYNLSLSVTRAEVVMTYLQAKGVTADRMTAVGMGEANPVGDNDTEAGRAENRRVVLELTD